MDPNRIIVHLVDYLDLLKRNPDVPACSQHGTVIITSRQETDNAFKEKVVKVVEQM